MHILWDRLHGPLSQPSEHAQYGFSQGTKRARVAAAALKMDTWANELARDMDMDKTAALMLNGKV